MFAGVHRLSHTALHAHDERRKFRAVSAETVYRRQIRPVPRQGAKARTG
jgi:hypothetical protein